MKTKEIKINGVISGLDITEHDVMKAIQRNGWRFIGDVEERKEEPDSLKRAVKDMADYVEDNVIGPIKDAVKEILKDKKDASKN